MHVCETPEYDALIYALLGVSGGNQHLDARVWCAIEGHQFIRLEGVTLEYRTADGQHVGSSTLGLMRLTTDERHAFALLPETVAVTVWRRPTVPRLHGQRTAECRIASGADPLGMYEVKGANTVPLAICATWLAYKRREHRARTRAAAK